jgi:hypothetical protein
VLDGVYKLLHPFMPFMTEELWTLTADRSRHADLPRRMAATGFRGRGSGKRNQLADRSRHRDPLGARGDECAGIGHGAARDGWRNDMTTEARLLRHDPAIKRLARVKTSSSRARCRRLGATRDRRGDGVPAAWRISSIVDRGKGAPARAPHSSFLYAMGLSREEIAQPLVGVASAAGTKLRPATSR